MIDISKNDELQQSCQADVSGSGVFIVVMFPYPSGSGLHCGHWYNYAIMDSYCRYKRFIGIDVFQPFGYDAFGLPAENYAKQVSREPKEVTYENIEKLDSYGNNVAQFIRYAISEKIKREHLSLLPKPKKEYCPF